MENYTDNRKKISNHFLVFTFVPCILKFFFPPGATTPIGGCILQPSSGFSLLAYEVS